MHSSRTAPLLLALLLAFTAASSGCNQFPGVSRFIGYDFLKDDKYTSMLIEIDYVKGSRLESSSVSLLQQRAVERLNKPDGITTREQEFTGGRDVWSVDDLKAAEKANRNDRASGKQIVLYVLVVNGNSDRDNSDGKVLGIHYGPTSVAIFKDTIKSGSITGLGVTSVERAVLVHEFGHVLGLVNTGLPMVTNHEDPNHKGHSGNKESVMYWAIETTDIFAAFVNPPPTNFDSNDIADLRAGGGK
jgi:hypothetical protein